MIEIEPWWVLAAVLWLAWDRFVDVDDDEPDEWTPEGARAALEAGEISVDERARRSAAAAEAPDGFRDALERVDGVGPDLSGRIRAEFPGPEFVQRASIEDLEAIHGVGESTATAIKDRFSET